MTRNTAVSRGACHCGAITYEVFARPRDVLECNCSICTMKAYLHWYVDKDQFALLSGADRLSTYTFGTRVAKHHFCRVCGIAPYYVPRSHPDMIDVNARTLLDIDLSALVIRPFDGKNWDAAAADLRRRLP